MTCKKKALQWTQDVMGVHRKSVRRLSTEELREVAIVLPNLHRVPLFFGLFSSFGRPVERFYDLLSDHNLGFVDFIRKLLYNNRLLIR